MMPPKRLSNLAQDELKNFFQPSSCQYAGVGDHVISRTRSSEELVCLVMKLQDIAIEDGKCILKLRFSSQCASQPVKSWQRFSNVAVGFDELLERIVVVDRDL
jgi:hypothetical protein